MISSKTFKFKPYKKIKKPSVQLLANNYLMITLKIEKAICPVCDVKK